MSQVQNLISSLRTRSLNINNFNTNVKFLDQIASDMIPANLIGKGAFGESYLVMGGKYVVKQIRPCSYQKDEIWKKYCVDIETLVDGGNFSIIPGGNGKFRYLLPNLMSEIVIGMLLGRMVDDRETLGFARTVGSFVLKELGTYFVYIIMDAYFPLLVEKQINPNLKLNSSTFLPFLFQMSHALLQAQQKYRFTHYDLHAENILWDLWDGPDNYIKYPLPNRSQDLIISKKDCPFIVKIADFGLSRLETPFTMVTPLVDTFPEYTFGEFNPSYDWVSFIGAMLFDPRQYPAFSFIPSDLKLFRFLLIFLLWMFNDKTKVPDSSIFEDYLKIRQYIGEKYYEPWGQEFQFRPQRPETNYISYIPSKSMVEIVNYLADQMFREGKGLSDSPFEETTHIRRLSSNYQNYNPVVPFIVDLPLDNKNIAPGGFKFVTREMIIDDGIKAKSVHLITNSVPNPYNLTLSEKQRIECPYQEHFITSIEISKPFSYKFGLDCCKIDPVNYLRESGKTGFVINGGFFSINKDYFPIGLYRDSNFSSDKYEIPSKYSKYYRFIVLKSNSLSISRFFPDDPETKFFVSGPVLIENRKIVFSPNLDFTCFEERFVSPPIQILAKTETTITTNGYFKYSSEEINGRYTCKKIFIEEAQEYPRCDRVSPGELSHAGNPNPRSALAILDDGRVVFFAIEGRGKRGVGIDLLTLAQSILTTYPNVVSAVNLDGGGSSNLAWRTVSEKNKVYISNPNHLYAYPVGNILSFTSL